MANILEKDVQNKDMLEGKHPKKNKISSYLLHVVIGSIHYSLQS